MKRVSRDGGKLVYRLGRQERGLLLAVLDRYPLIPPAHQPVSRNAPAGAFQHCQQLLDEALADQRKENRRRLKSLLRDPKRFRETDTGWLLVLSAADREWLLQILNDLRVGSWLRLGSPEEDLPEMDLDAEQAPDALTMEMAGQFQMRLLEQPD
jgi:hypothetical protein